MTAPRPPTHVPTMLSGGFRPFFLGAGVWAVLVVALWMASLQDMLSNASAFDAATWHLHEMIFGYFAAAMAGFMLTALPNWTGRRPLHGRPLALLVGLWLSGRVAVWYSEPLSPIGAACIDLSFLFALLAIVLREIWAGRNWRNLPVAVAVGGLLLANTLLHVEVITAVATGDIGSRLALSIVVGLISLIGGRVVPSFTRNWLDKRGERALPAPFGSVDRVSLALVVGALAAWIGAPDHGATGAALVVAGVASFVRLARWRGHRTGPEALVWSLHVGFLWLPVGLTLLGIAAATDALSPSAALHALGIGAIGSMSLAVMTRATLGHTGRALHADGISAAIYGLVLVTAIARVLSASLAEPIGPLLWAAAGLWIAAFCLFSARYGAMLVRR